MNFIFTESVSRFIKSRVINDIPANVIVVGNPAKIILMVAL